MDHAEMTTLYLVRHGETIDNARKIMQGQTQGELTEKGWQQARMLAAQLRDTRIDAFVASDLKRAVDTCRVIADSRGMPVETTPLLRERDWGGFTGRYIPDLKDEAWPDDIESLDALKERGRQFLCFVAKHFPGQNVLAVGHGIINKAIQAAYHDKPMNEIPRMENIEVRVLRLESQ